MRLRQVYTLFFIAAGLIVLPWLVYARSSGWHRTVPSSNVAPYAPVAAGIFKDNLLVNPSFEGDFYFDPPSSLMAEGWTSWFIESRPTDHRPEWNEEVLISNTKLSWRVRHGNKAQKMFSSFSTHQGGFYQQVKVKPGAELAFSIWAQVWSSDCDVNCISPLEPGVVCESQNTHGNYRVSIGIDPTGGTDPLAPTVEWQRYRLAVDIPYDVWNRLEITATAQAPQVTVFTEGWAEFQVKHNDSYWEDAALAYVTPPDLPLAAYLPLILRNHVATPVSTATPTATLIPTRPAVTITPTTTATPTTSPTATATLTPTSTATVISTHTAVVPTSTPTVTPACQDLIHNGDFEADNGWTFQSDVPYPPELAPDPVEDDQALRLGIPPDSANLESWSAAWQALTVPATPDSATLTFKYYPESTDLVRDYFEVRVLDAAGAPIGALIHPLDGQSNARAWISAAFDLSQYANQTIQLYFNVYNDGQNGMARVYVDDVVVEVCGVPTSFTRLQAASAGPPQFDLLQDVAFGQVRFTWARYGKHTPNVNWTGCQNPSDLEVEWVYVINVGDQGVDLEGWTLEDGDGNLFTFPKFRLRAHEGLRIWSDDRENGPNDVFMRRSEPVWDDDADRATLRWPNGELATGSLCWFEAGGSPIACPDENP